MTLHSSYDYIITGAGCAGLSLLVQLIQSGQATGKRILLVDEQEKNKNDRTWCFWEKEPGPFDTIVSRRWQQLWFHGQDYSRLLDIAPYTYKLIRGIDFYNYCRQIINQAPGVEWIKAKIEKVGNAGNDQAEAEINGQMIKADYLFNSILFKTPVLQKKEWMLLQHFRGWVIKADKPVFHPDQAILMDFRIPQTQGTTFVYVMPFSATEALVEYTLFTSELLEPEVYDNGLKMYMERYYPGIGFEIRDIETGVIPMTNYRFKAGEGRVIQIGTAGGDTKASSGYTFQFIQKRSAAITAALKAKDDRLLHENTQSGKFRFYDSVLLNVLYNKRVDGATVFSRMFQKNNPARILKFLDNSSSLADDLRIIASLPVSPFLKAAIRQLT